MPQIDFHVLPDASHHGRLAHAARLAAKAWRSGLGVLIHCPDQDSARQIDQLLWERPPASFVPHQLAGSNGQSPLLLSWPGADTPAGPELCRQYPVLVNLCLQPPDWYEGHQRIFELVNQNPEVLAAMRDSFTSYRQRGYSPKHTRIHSQN